jgi:hypothetical protein
VTNRYRPHVLVVPEDDVNRQIANGFLLDPSILIGNIQVLEEVGGWLEVLARFKSDLINGDGQVPRAVRGLADRLRRPPGAVE